MFIWCIFSILEESIFGDIKCCTTLWNIYFWLSISKVDIYRSVCYFLTIGCWIENVTDCCTISKWCIWHSNLNSIVWVSYCNEEFSSWEAVKIIQNILLLHRMVPDLVSFSSIINCCCKLVNIWLRIHSLPQRFSVLRIISTSISLLTSIIKEWDTSGSLSE